MFFVQESIAYKRNRLLYNKDISALKRNESILKPHQSTYKIL